MIKLHQLLISIMLFVSLIGGYLFIFNDATNAYDKEFDSEIFEELRLKTNEISDTAERMSERLREPENIGFNIATFQAFGSGAYQALLLFASSFSSVSSMIAIGISVLPLGSFGNTLLISLIGALLVWIFLGVIVPALLGDSSRI